jgi:hypothetical protein
LWGFLSIDLIAASKAISFLLKSRSCLIYFSRKEIGHGKVTRSDENGFGVEELQSSNPDMLFDLDEEFCSSFSSMPGGVGRCGDSGVSSSPHSEEEGLTVRYQSGV